MSAWVVVLAVGSVAILFPLSFSEFVDKFVIIYTLLAGAAIALYVKEVKGAKVEESKAYTFKKKSDIPLTFEQLQSKICGTWEKTSRKNFIEFLQWTGELKPAAAYMVGSKLDSDPMTMFIKYKDASRKEMMIWSEGFPNPGPSQYLAVQADPANPQKQYFESDNGSVQDKGYECLYWDEKNMALIRARESNRSKIEITQERKLIDEENLVLTIRGKKMPSNPNIKTGPETFECQMFFKFKGPHTPEPPALQPFKASSL